MTIKKMVRSIFEQYPLDKIRPNQLKPIIFATYNSLHDEDTYRRRADELVRDKVLGREKQGRMRFYYKLNQ